MAVSEFLYKSFLSKLKYEPTECQENFFSSVAEFLSGDDNDIFVLDGYAGTGKTTAVSAVIATMAENKTKCVLLAPTGRAAKVLSHISGRKAYTVHKHIYRQKAVGGDGFGQFSLSPNKDRDTLFVVDEVSLIGIGGGDGQNQSMAAFGSGNLLEDLVAFVRNGVNCKLLMVGDSAQLPPVGLDASPALSKEYMAIFGGTVFARMHTVVRQKLESGILYNATLVRKLIYDLYSYAGSLPRNELGLSLDGYTDIERVSGGELIDRIGEAYGKYGEDETMILCRSNKRAIRYNLGIRSTVQFKEERLVRGDKLMIVKNCYQFLEDHTDVDYIANGDIAKLVKIGQFEERYGLNFAVARLSFPDYDDMEIVAKVVLDTLESESAALTYEQQNALYRGVDADYAITYPNNKKKRYEAVREDRYYNALQLKYAAAVTCHKSQGGQWKCVFIDNAFWQEEMTVDDLKWLYTALTRAVEKVYLVNFSDEMFE